MGRKRIMYWSFRTGVNKKLPPRMTQAQARRVRRLIRRLCANYDAGNCLLLDAPCPQFITLSLLCKYFRAAVLPADIGLYAVLFPDDMTNICPDCGRWFISRSRNTVYCSFCAAERTRRSKRKWAREHRSAARNQNR